MSLERIQRLIERFREALGRGPEAFMTAPGFSLGRELGIELLDSMLLARHLDRAAHELRASGHGHYTICSSGHEANVALGRLTEISDPSLVHYRSAAFQIERARKVSDIDPVRDIALSLVASSEEPASGGRHKVFGHPRLGIIPGTSTIASQAPRALGLAFALEQSARLGDTSVKDAIVVCSFGDASLNHSTLAGTLNAASWIKYQNLKLPLLFVCEDNGLGISVRTPPGWVAERASALPGIRSFSADGSSVEATYRAAADAVTFCRTARRPAFLHLECVRLLGHAGSDVDETYRSNREIEAAFSRDPLLCHALSLAKAGCLTPAAILSRDLDAATRVDREAERAKGRPRLTSREAVTSTIESREVSKSVEREAVPPTTALRSVSNERLTLAQGLNRALSQALEEDPRVLVFGEDVAKKGGVYGITKGLFDRFGPLRVFNTLLDEQTILGMALGAGTLGLLPIPELQYLAYLHNAEDQLRGEAATFGFFSQGAYKNPMLLRIAGLAYQKGFGGHFHNDNSLAVLRDIPGISVAVPARADDALELFRCGLKRAREHGSVIVMVEPIALYHRKDLAQEGDGAWLAADTGQVAELGRARVYHADAPDLTIATYGNGLALSLAAAAKLERLHGLRARVLDLRWIAPLPEADLSEHARGTGRLLCVDECRRSGNVSEAIGTLMAEQRPALAFARVTAADSFIPLGEAADQVLVQEDQIFDAALRLCRA